MKHQIRRYGSSLAAIIVLMVVSVVVGGYILTQQHLSTPLQDRYTMKAAFASTNGLTPGLGQPANVAGVRVGSIASVELVDGQAVASVEIDPKELKHVYRDAHVVLFPNTPLKDMQINITPGHKAAGVLRDGGTIPIAQTTPPIDSDELTAALDGDTRDFLQLLVGGAETGLRGRGEDLRRLLKALGPTSAQIRQLGDSLAARRHEMRRLVHSLAVVGRAVDGKDQQLGQVVDSANATLGALARQQAALQSSVAKLPATLQATQSTLRHTTAFAHALGPAARALEPTARELPATLRALSPLVAHAPTIIRTQLRPFVRDFLPLVAGRGTIARRLVALTPALSTAFQVAGYLANELAYNPPGDNEGMLFWTAWFLHNADSFMSTSDANGAAFRGLVLVSCSSLIANPAVAPLLSSILGSLPAC